MDIEILLMDHVIFFEDKDIDLMIHADIFHKTGSSHTYPVHIYIRRGGASEQFFCTEIQA